MTQFQTGCVQSCKNQNGDDGDDWGVRRKCALESHIRNQIDTPACLQVTCNECFLNEIIQNHVEQEES